MRDSQRSKVYRMERDVWAELGPDHPSLQHMTLEACTALAHRLCDDYKIRRVTVLDGRGRRNASYFGWRHAIALPRWARFPLVVAHEVAHGVVRSGPAHGPEFVRTLIWMSETVGVDPVLFWKHAEKHGVKTGC